MKLEMENMLVNVNKKSKLKEINTNKHTKYKSAQYRV